MTYVSATPDQGTCAVAGAVVTCDLGRIDERQDADMTVVARGDAVGPQVNEAEVTTSLNTEVDPTDNTRAVDGRVGPGRRPLGREGRPGRGAGRRDRARTR